MSRVLLVGEQNPYGSDPAFALWPEPANCAGDRLCRKIMGMRRRDYLAAFDRTNLCEHAWSTKDARAAASRLMMNDPPRMIILLGAKVTSAFRNFGTDGLLDFGLVATPKVALLRLPHPSGRNLRWNDPGAAIRARGVLAAFLPPDVAALIGSAPDGD